MWDINGFICSDSVSCHVLTGARVFLILPQNLQRNNLGSWQLCSSALVIGIFIREKKNKTPQKHHRGESSSGSSLSWVCCWVFWTFRVVPRFISLGAALLVLWFLQCPSIPILPYPSVFFHGKIPPDSQRETLDVRERERKILKLCGQTWVEIRGFCSPTPRWISVPLLILYLLVFC